MSMLRPTLLAFAVSSIFLAHEARAQSTPFCFGDGTGTACPCANFSTPGNNEGCLNSLSLGGKLVSTGVSSVSNDTYVLFGSQMPNGPCLYFQGSLALAGGAGVVFGDGLRCVGGTVVRLGIKTNVAGQSQYPALGDIGIATKAPPIPPQTCYNQTWYRDSAPFCTAPVFNLTNGVSTTWIP